MRRLIQLSGCPGRGAAQASITAAKSALQVTRKRSRRTVLASECDTLSPSSGMIPRSRGSTQ